MIVNDVKDQFQLVASHSLKRADKRHLSHRFHHAHPSSVEGMEDAY